MGKMTIVDDDGTIEEFDQFIALGVKDGQVTRFIEDEGLSSQDYAQLLVGGVKLLGEIGDLLIPDREGKEDS